MNVEYRAYDEKERDYIQALYESSFPESEKKPFQMILQTNRSDRGNMYSIFKDEVCVGLLFTLENKKHILIDYLAIDPERQNEQIGSEVLRAFFKQAKKPIVLEIEAIDTARDRNERELRKKRKAFYVRNGMEAMDYHVDLFGVEMEILTYGGVLSFREYLKILQECVSKGVDPYVKELVQS